MIGAVVEHAIRLTLTAMGADEEPRDVTAVLDMRFNGALTLPHDLIRNLGLPVVGRRRVVLADGTSRALPLHLATIDWDGDQREVLALAMGSEALVGMSLLDGHRVVLHIVEGDGVTTRSLALTYTRLFGILRPAHRNRRRFSRTLTAPETGAEQDCCLMLGFAILGPGRFAESRVAPALNRAGNCRLVAAVSRNRERAAAFAEEYGAARAYDDLAAALADPEVEAVWVATPHALHREHVEQIAAARRHVLCEKPLATSVEDARAIVRACRQAGVALGAGYHLRHHPLHREARRLVEEGALGEVAAAQAEWSLPPSPPSASAPWRRDPALSGGGIVTGTGIHAIDLLRFVLGDEVESVSALTNAATSPISPLESRALVLLRFGRGTLATVRCARGVHAPQNDLLLQGVTGSLTAHRTIDEMTRGTLEVSGADSPMSGVPAGSDMYALQARAFAEAVARGEEPDASGEDGLRLVQIATALYESARSGRTVVL